MTESVVVRPAKPGDAAPIAQIHVTAWQVAYDGLVPAEVLAGQSVERRHAWWATRLASPPERGLRTDVAVADDHVIGFCVTGPSRDDDAETTVGEVHAIYVSPSHWAVGAGSALLTAAEQHLHDELACTQATLWVLHNNHRTRAWYERRGWHADGSQRHENRGSMLLFELRYRKHLSRLPDHP